MSKDNKSVDSFVEIYRPGGQVEILFIKSVLDPAGIYYYINNENFNRIFPAMGSMGVGEMRLMVEKTRAVEALLILKDVLELKTIG